MNSLIYRLYRKLKITAILIVLLHAVGSFDVRADQSLADIQINPKTSDSTRTISLPHSLDYRPLFYTDEDGTSKGLLVDYWKLWSQKTGIRVKFEAYPWHECLERVRQGQSDVLPGVFYTAERDAYLDFSQSFMEIKTILFIRNSTEIENLNQMAEIPIGVTRDDRTEVFIRTIIEDAELEVFEGFEDVIRAAADDKLNAFAMDYPCASYFYGKIWYYR